MIEIVGLWSQGDGLPRGVMGGMNVPSLEGQALGSRDHSLCLVMYITLTRLTFFPPFVRPPLRMPNPTDPIDYCDRIILDTAKRQSFCQGYFYRRMMRILPSVATLDTLAAKHHERGQMPILFSTCWILENSKIRSGAGFGDRHQAIKPCSIAGASCTST